jgi:glycerophosphoryl diester phosphodiesterase
MKLFAQRDLTAARAYAAAGGQALHVMSGAFGDADPTAPNCFKNQKQIAHLFDQDKERLIKTVKRLGVRVIFVDREDTIGQHIDLCKKPLERAIQESEWPRPKSYEQPD